MSLKLGAMHHLTLTVSDLQRSLAFYQNILGFKLIMELPAINRLVLSNDAVMLILGLPPQPENAIQEDQFNENRIGLDHLSFAVSDYAAMQAAVEHFDKHGVEHGEIRDLLPLAGLPIYVMALRDPDNIQLELTAPHSS